MKFTDLDRPFIIGVVSDGEVQRCIRTIKLGEYDGADGFQLELHNFKEYPPSKTQMKDIMGSTTKPIWTTNRRKRAGQITVNDSRRIKLELDALDAGAMGMDMEMDTFDPWFLWDPARRRGEWPRLQDIPVEVEDFPRECSFHADAVRKQRKIIEQVHSMGAEILLSCHVLVRTRPEGVLKIAQELEARGADLIKIVVWNDTLSDLCDTLKANVLLSERMRVPFKLMSQGEPSKLGRALFSMFGSAWAFCQQDLRPGGFHYRPLIATQKYIQQHLDWRPNWAQHARLQKRRDEILQAFASTDKKGRGREAKASVSQP